MAWHCLNIRGNENRTEVIVLLQNESCQLIARFLRNPVALDAIETQVVSYFEELETTETEGRSFPIKASLKDAILRAVDEVWLREAYAPGDIHPDSVLSVSTTESQMRGDLTRECAKYQTFLTLLKPIDQLLERSKNHKCLTDSSVATLESEQINLEDVFDSFRGACLKARVKSSGSRRVVFIYSEIARTYTE
jgi:hypothetical protein